MATTTDSFDNGPEKGIPNNAKNHDQLGGTNKPYRIEAFFANLLPALTLAQLSELKKLILEAKKCENALVCAKIDGEEGLILIDGHQRDRLVDELRNEGHEIAAPTISIKEFKTRYEAAEWIIRNQKGRRNWEEADRARWILENEELVTAIQLDAQKRQEHRGKADLGFSGGQGPNGGRTDEQLAQLSDTSRSTIARVRKILDSKNQEVIGAAFNQDRSKRMPITKAAEIVTDEKKSKTIKDRQRKAMRIVLPPPPTGSLLDEIHCMDVLQGLRKLGDESVHVILTSPPYPIFGVVYDLWSFKDNCNGSYERYLDWMRQIFAEFKRILVRGGRLVLNIDATNNREGPDGLDAEDLKFVHDVHADIAYIATRELGLLFYGDHIWFKQKTVGTTPNYGSYGLCSQPNIRRNAEYILMYSKDQRLLEGDPALCDIDPEEFKTFGVQHWYIPPVPRKDVADPGYHPAAYPEELAYRVIRQYSYVGNVVLDPFSGTGTTCFVAKALNRRFVGFDNSPLYVESSKKRLITLDGKTRDEQIAMIRRYIPPIDERSDGYGLRKGK